MYWVSRYKNTRFWGVYMIGPNGTIQLLGVTVYRKGALNIVETLKRVSNPQTWAA